MGGEYSGMGRQPRQTYVFVRTISRFGRVLMQEKEWLLVEITNYSVDEVPVIEVTPEQVEFLDTVQ